MIIIGLWYIVPAYVFYTQLIIPAIYDFAATA